MFKKGTQVWVLQNWDSKGTVYARQAIVDSCGKRQMNIRLMDGKMSKSRIYVQHINHWEPQYRLCEHVIVGTAEEAQAYGLKLAAAILEAERAHLDRCLADETAGEYYHASIRKSMAALHEARFEDRTVKA